MSDQYYEEDPHYAGDNVSPFDVTVGYAARPAAPVETKIQRFFHHLFNAHPVVVDPTDDTSNVDNQVNYRTSAEQNNLPDIYVDDHPDSKTSIAPVQVYEVAAPSFGTHHEVVGTTAVRLVARNPLRKSVQLIFWSTNTANVAIGPDNTVKASGIGNPNGNAEYPPGSTQSIETTADIWFVAASGTQDISIIELNRDGQ